MVLLISKPAIEWSIHLQYEKHGACDRQCTDKQGREDGQISRGKQPKAGEGDREPECEDPEERDRNGAAAAGSHEPPRLEE